jgi:hypothetical protein
MSVGQIQLFQKRGKSGVFDGEFFGQVNFLNPARSAGSSTTTGYRDIYVPTKRPSGSSSQIHRPISTTASSPGSHPASTPACYSP